MFWQAQSHLKSDHAQLLSLVFGVRATLTVLSRRDFCSVYFDFLKNLSAFAPHLSKVADLAAKSYAETS